jgi:predicted deacylase
VSERMKRSSVGPFEVADAAVTPGARERLQLPVARLPAGGWLSLPIEVVHGAEPGPAVFLSGTIHGDELDGLEIIRRVLDGVRPESLAGTVVAAPIVNLPGLVAESRYLPDRRDLNRAFPGSANGSLAARLAHLFMTEVVRRCSHGIDFHCGSDDRENLPQVRADLDDDETRRLARAFGAPVTIHAQAPAGSLRRAAVRGGGRVLLYEAGEARRFTASAIRTGAAGARRVLAALGMVDAAEDGPPSTVECRTRRWVRAGRSGVCRLDVELGDEVRKGEVLGEISNALGTERSPVRSRASGIVIGRRIHPIVYQGEALVHIAEPEPPEPAPTGPDAAPAAG